MSALPYFLVSNLGCKREQRVLFSDLSFSLQPGEAVFVEGANGVGKSSLLRLLAGIASPYHGDIFWQGQPIQENSLGFQEALHYLGHQNGIKLGLTVAENLQLMTTLSLTSHTTSPDIVLTLLQLHQHRDKLAKHLSAGQRRRLGLARLFLIKKKIWLLDEPLTALDVDTQQLFLAQLEQHLEQGGIVVASSHHAIAIKRPHTTVRLTAC